MTTEKRGGWAGVASATLRLIAFAAAAVLLVASGATAGDERASSLSNRAASESKSALPDKRLLIGTWREAREDVLLRFHRNDTFKIGSDLRMPFAIGTYRLSGSIVRFKPVGPWCLDPWVWKASVRDGVRDELDVYFVTRACDVAKKTKWRFTRSS